MKSKNLSLTSALRSVEALYCQNLKDHGLTPKSSGWKDEASQRLRFEKLIQTINPEELKHGFTVNDLGCGYGAMFSYLDAAFPQKMTKYYGYDVGRDILCAARKSINDKRAIFINKASATKIADYSFVSGTFNVKLQCDHETWTEYVKACLKNLSSNSIKGFGFNLLTTYVDWKDDNLYYGDPLFFLDYCKSNLSRFVSLLHDYQLYEWTIFVHKER